MNSRKLADQYVEIDHPYFDAPSDPLVHLGERRDNDSPLQLDWRQVIGGVAILVGIAMLLIGWIQISGTKDTYQQLSYFSSAGLGGAAAVIIGATVLVTFEHYSDRQSLAAVDARLAALEARLSAEFAALGEQSPPARTTGASRTGRSGGAGTPARTGANGARVPARTASRSSAAPRSR